MKIIRRDLLYLTGIAAVLPMTSRIAWAQTQAGPKLTQILRKDMEAQDHVVQETVVSVVEIEGGETTLLKTGEAAIVPADIVHLARNESIGASGKALVVHSRAAKDKP